MVKLCILCSTNVFYQIIKMGMYNRLLWSKRLIVLLNCPPDSWEALHLHVVAARCVSFISSCSETIFTNMSSQQSNHCGSSSASLEWKKQVETTGGKTTWFSCRVTFLQWHQWHLLPLTWVHWCWTQRQQCKQDRDSAGPSGHSLWHSREHPDPLISIWNTWSTGGHAE